ncbi:MAG: hypothetical protein QM736_03970 [Vicinamibacterales bacterium]
MTAPGIKGSYHTRWVSGDGAERVDGPDLNLGPPGVDTRWYYDTDAIGSVRLVTDANGTVVERHDYLPFGTEWPLPSSGGAIERKVKCNKRATALMAMRGDENNFCCGNA